MNPHFFPLSPQLTVCPQEIVQIQGESNYSRLFLCNGQELVVSITLCVLQARLPSVFVRIHKSHLVNLRYFDKIMRRQKQMRLINGLRLPISRRRATEVFTKVAVLNN